MSHMGACIACGSIYQEKLYCLGQSSSQSGLWLNASEESMGISFELHGRHSEPESVLYHESILR